MSRVDTVLFDGDDTLWDYQESMRAALRLVLEELWSRRPDSVAAGLDVDRLIEIRHRVAAELRGRVLDLAVIRLAAFERTLEEIGMPDQVLASELTSSFFAHRFRLMNLVDGAQEMLQELHGRYRLGLVTNGMVLPERFGLEDLFGVAVTAVSAGAAKPDPAIFAPALAALGSTADRAAYVGDSVADDVAGARAAGLMSVWFNRNDLRDPRPKPDYEIVRLAQLPDLLARLPPGVGGGSAARLGPR